ncbi:winged helix-turn-helix domain-containing protein [Paenirhodobacter populi]|nr:winged helix-turn-helix domain-containing protein [Sinirhodobacter populi]
MTIRSDIMALPPEDRLPAALAVIGDLTGEEDGMVTAYRGLGLTQSEARIAACLTKRAPGAVTPDAMSIAATGLSLEPTSLETVRVYLVRIRRKLAPAIRIINIHGEGYRIEGDFPKPVPSVPVQIPGNIRRQLTPRGRAGQPWTPDDDAALAEMRTAGSDWWAIADELERSERAVQDRWKVIGARPGGEM